MKKFKQLRKGKGARVKETGQKGMQVGRRLMGPVTKRDGGRKLSSSKCGSLRKNGTNSNGR